ncbi:VanZ family protein [Paenibacillus montanisoli]|uniref:VanZ family protein n=1 Tax=Paenibacillus montanisoli TaxID=2081970 RepID=A0A328TYD4_9BACL|nr:VanZ family protein [Paenibacillus montanisoli]RAP74513.1 VanZ family protein [Paenibacillus montanisoli]
MALKHKEKLKDIIIQASFVLYVYILFKIILFKFDSINMTFLWAQLKTSLENPDHIIRQFQSGNLIPFDEISKITQGMSEHGWINLFGNLAIFIPYGFLLGAMLRNKKISCTDGFILSFALSQLLESAQVLFAIGIFDIDDLILNSTGGLIGFIIFKLFARSVTALSVIHPEAGPSEAVRVIPR